MSRQHASPPGWDESSPPGTRSHSEASDRTSVPRFPLFSPSLSSRLSEPAYVAASAASQIVTSDQDPRVYSLLADDDDYYADPRPAGVEPALVTPASLKLINGFLDHLLYNFLAISRSTSFSALRSAVYEILRPTLAREAISNADQELQEYLGAGLQKELTTVHEPADPASGWDVDAVWRRARVRCMVYSSLGDLEEEDDGSFRSEDHQFGASIDGRGHNSADNAEVIPPAVAIFLAAILEFVAEQVLLIAAQAAMQRLQAKKLESISVGVRHNPSAPMERLVVEELDAEKVALNPTFGRLWRGWRKRVRSPSASFSRSVSRDSAFRRRSYSGLSPSSRKSSFDAQESSGPPLDRSSPTSLAGVPEEEVAASIALPLSENDIEEIEVPGAADIRRSQPSHPQTSRLDRRGRTKSLPALDTIKGRTRSPPVPGVSRSLTVAESRGGLYSKPRPAPWRSQSQPAPERAAFSFSVPDASPDDATFFTPLQSPDTGITDMPHASPLANDVSMNEMNSSQPSSSNSPQISEGFATSPISGMAVMDGKSNRLVEPVSDSVSPPPSSIESAVDAPEPPTIEQGLRTAVIKTMQSHSATLQSSAPNSASSRGRAAEGARGHSADRGSADPDTIGVAHTTNVPLPAPVLVPSVRLSPRRPLSDISPTFDEASEPLATSRTSYRRTGSLDHGHIRANDFSDAHRPRQELDSAGSLRRLEKKEWSTASAQSDWQNDTRAPATRAQVPASGNSPLNPLEELTEDFLEVSDEGPLGAHGLGVARSDSAVIPGSLLNGHASMTESTTSSSSLKQPSGTRRSESRQLSSLSIGGSSTDRASVQRVFTPPTTPMDTLAPTSKRSASVNKGSSSPQLAQKVKGVLSRSQDDTERQSRTVGPPEEVGRNDLPGKSLPAKPSPRDAERSFEQLIRSDETIQYTLTPPTVRDMETPISSRRPDATNPSVSYKRAGMVDFPPRSVPQSSVPSIGSRETRPDVSAAPGLTGASRSPGTANLIVPSRPAESSTLSTPKLGFIPHAPPGLARVRQGAPMARDARPDRTSTKHIAEFIRSTGPERGGPDDPTAPLPSRVSSLPDAASTRRSTPPKTTRSASAKRKPRMEARQEEVFRREDSSDLVDFIRQGPPDEKQPISKAIAPFRTTMDSDQFSSLTNGQRIDGDTTLSIISTQNGSSKSHTQSYSSSFHSHSALLGGGGGGGGGGGRGSENGGLITRKQRRVKDPYPLDDLDIDDDDLEIDDEDVAAAATLKPQKEEESLMDFLRSIPPPPTEAIPSAFDNVPKPSSKGFLKRDPSGTIKSRFGRNDSAKRATATSPSLSSGPLSENQLPPSDLRAADYSSSRASASASPSGLAPSASASVSVGRQSPPMHSMIGSGGTVVGAGSSAGAGSSGGTVTGSGSGRRNLLQPSGGSVGMGGHPASARNEYNNMRDLADFFKNTAPPGPPPTLPPSLAPVALPAPAAKNAAISSSSRGKVEGGGGGGGLAKIFRKKKSNS